MLNSKRIIAGLGVVAGLGVAMLPLTSYADTVSDTSDAETITVNVADTISVSVSATYASGSAIAVNQGEENTAGLTHTVTVAGNTYNDYTLTVAASNTNLVHSSVSSATIPTLSEASSTLSAGSWGYQYTTAAGGSAYNGTWQPLSTSGSTIHSASGTKSTTYSEDWGVKYGVKAAENQLSGTYTTTVTYTATANAAV